MAALRTPQVFRDLDGRLRPCDPDGAETYTADIDRPGPIPSMRFCVGISTLIRTRAGFWIVSTEARPIVSGPAVDLIGQIERGVGWKADPAPPNRISVDDAVRWFVSRGRPLPESLRRDIGPPADDPSVPRPEAFQQGTAEASEAGSPGTEPTPEAKPRGRLTIEGKALAAAYDLKREGRPVTVKAAAERAGVNRSHLTKRYPEAVRLIKALGTPDGRLPRGVKDRAGTIEAADDDDD